MLAKVISGAVIGIDAYLVEVEVDIVHGLPAFTTVGLPETAVKESKERVRAAIKNSGHSFPDDRITVNLAPAHIKKEGTGFDLPIALGILAATDTIPRSSFKRWLFAGELSLDGRVKPVYGCLPITLAACKAGYQGILVPYANRREAAVVSGIDVYPVRNLAQVVAFIQGNDVLSVEANDAEHLMAGSNLIREDFAEVKGQAHVKRALEIAAAGGHNLLMIGPPGAGKTMLAKRLPSIMPPMTFEEAIETTKIHSVTGMLTSGQSLITQRPFRSPHHTISDAGLIGGGVVPRPGEVSLAHNGVLFLDELPEYRKHVLEVMRQPLEDKQVTIARASSAITYPANFMLVAAMNPCPCGYFTDTNHTCRCSLQQIQRYRSKISGPLLDRIDMHLEVPAVPFTDLVAEPADEGSQAIRERVKSARNTQVQRFGKCRIFSNAQMASRHVRTHCGLSGDSRTLLERAIDRFGLSARGYHRILKIARTIADLAGEESIGTVHLSEAIQYRTLDRSVQLG